MEDLPDDILLLVYRKIHGMAGDNINKIRRISQLGLVSRQMRQIERKFWRAQVNERRLTRPIKIPKEVKNNPKHIYIYTYLACHDCGGKSKFTCSKCSDNICETCAPDFTHKCDGRSSDLQCRSCVNRCPACQIPICQICSTQCFQCANIFCFDCTEHDVVNGHQLATGDTWVKVPSKCKTIKERRKECHINKLPTEVLVLIFEYVHGLAKETTLSTMRDVVNLGVTARFLRTAEVKFWAKYVRQILKLNVKSERSPKESFYLHLAHMPNKHRGDPKQIVIYSSFCCDHCAQKSLTKECRGCRSQVCYQNDHNCGSDVACGCKVKAFHCSSCKEEYFCDYCNRANICKECDYRCISCGDHFCSICFYSTNHTCWNSSSESSEEEEEVKEKIKCIQCTDEIEGDKDDEDIFGHCSKCDYYNEINNYKLCKKCVTPCRVCDEELCVNCMIIYHEPNEHWTTCQKCHEEWSLLDGPCDECETYDSCINCQIECKDCGKILCEECHEIHQQDHMLPELPDEIWLEIFKIVSCPRRAKTVDSLKKIFYLGSVNKKIKRVEEIFWRYLVNTNAFFSSKLKRSTKYTPKALHLNNYFGCTDCAKPTKFKCRDCETHICMECFEYTKSVECGCTSILGEPFVQCRSCSGRLMCEEENYCFLCNGRKCVSLMKKVYCSCKFVRACESCFSGLEYCDSCSKQLCPWCTKSCRGCKAKLCPKCEKKDRCNCPPPSIFPLFPSEILVHICEFIIRDPKQSLLDRVISVLKFTRVNKLLKMAESYFWKFIVSKEIENEIKFVPLNRRNYMPTNLVKDPKQLFLWNHLSCTSCGILDTKSCPIELKDGSLLECDKCHYSRGPFVSEDGVQYICQQCYDDMLICCNEMSRLYQLLPELPDDILLVIFKGASPSMKTVEAVKWITQLGSANKQFKRVEGYFWRHVVDSNPFFSSKLKTMPKYKPKDLHIKHYFSCNDCGKLTKYRCSGCCNTNMCLECYKYSRIRQCECMEKEGYEKTVFCRSCIHPCRGCGIESCHTCEILDVYCSICYEIKDCAHKVSKLHCACSRWENRWACSDDSDCKPSNYACRDCAKQFCRYCAEKCRTCYDVVCNKCSVFENIYARFCKSCLPFPGLILDLPQEIVIRILETIIHDTNDRLTYRAALITNIGLVNKQLNMIEKVFWQRIVAQEAANEIHLLPDSRDNHTLAKKAKTPKQLCFSQHFGCAKCGKYDNKSMPVEFNINEYLKCYHCGRMIGPYNPQNGAHCICQKCCKDRLRCCRNNKIRPEPFSYEEQGPEMICSHCERKIKNGSRQCGQCEHSVITGKELPGRRYCKQCTSNCAFCETELCRGCQAPHRGDNACSGFATCQKCQAKTQVIATCEDCASKGCDFCQFRCENCHGSVCPECLQRNNTTFGRFLCRTCTTDQ